MKPFCFIVLSALMIVVSILGGCSSTNNNASSREDRNWKADQVRDRPARNDLTSNHPSADRDGMIFYYGNNQGRRSNQTVISQFLLYTDSYRDSAETMTADRDIKLRKKISRDEMGAILQTMDQWGYFQWPASKDYSKMGPIARKSIGQISTWTTGRKHTTAWTSEDTESIRTVSDRARAKKFANLRLVLLQFCQSSDFEVSTSVEGR